MLGPTLTQLQAALQAKGYGTDSAAAQVLMLNSVARRVYGARRWQFFIETTTVNTTLGVGLATLPAGVHVIDAVRAEKATSYTDLKPADPEWLRSQQFVDRATGQPTHWAVQGGEIMLWPIPDAVYTLTISYTLYPPDMATGTDQAGIPYEFMDVIVWGAVQEMAFRQRDWPQADRAKQEYTERLAEMVHAFASPHRQQAFTVEASGYYDDLGDTWHP